MATVAGTWGFRDRGPDMLSGTPRAHAVDRWIFVAMAIWFIAIVFTGFIPDSLMKIEMVRTGARAPFPLVLHMHAVLMGSFLLILLAQTWLMATGRKAYHMQLGLLGYGIAALLVAVGIVLVRTIYGQIWGGAHFGPPEVRGQLQQLQLRLDNILLFQLRIGFLFPLFLALAFKARGRNAGVHKRMMFLGTAMALPAAIDRIQWLPTSLPAAPWATDVYTLLAVSPMFLWDLTRNRSVHPAYFVWLAVNLPIALLLYALWNSDGWHAVAPRILGFS